MKNEVLIQFAGSVVVYKYCFISGMWVGRSLRVLSVEEDIAY